jgi:two-component system, LytTR family, sensor kinase
MNRPKACRSQMSGSYTCIALQQWLIKHWFALTNSLFWLVIGLEAVITVTVLQSQVYQLPWFVSSRAVAGWLFCTWLHRSLQQRPRWRALKGWQRAALVISLLSVFAIGSSLLIRGVRLAIGDVDPAMSAVKFWVYVLGLELRLMVWAGFYLLIAESRERLQVQARSLLSAAFQPHFLMNAMNALIACRHDPDAVESAGEGLAGYLRYTLDRSESEWEPLGAQLEALSNYLSVEELRFGSRLHARVNSDPHLLQQVVPRFLLQPLVENAIKHGAINGYGTMQLLISLEQESGRLQLQVSNNGEIAPAASHNPGVGYGLSSLRQRLQLHYGDQAELSLMQQGAWVVATILLPLR